MCVLSTSAIHPKQWFSTSVIVCPPSPSASDRSLTSVRARFVARTNAASTRFRIADAQYRSIPFSSRLPMPINKPPRTTRCFHRWLRSSAPTTMARIQSSSGRPPPIGDWPGSSFGALFHRTSLWCFMMVVTAAWNTESSRRGVRTPSGRSQSAGAVRRCEVRRLRL